MKEFLGIIKYEFIMSIRRKALFIIALLFIGLFMYMNIQVLHEYPDLYKEFADPTFARSQAASSAFSLNMFFPVIVGISAADRAIRDKKIGTKELLNVTKINNTSHLFGKYLGITLSYILVETAILLIYSLYAVILLGFPTSFILDSLIAMFILSVPSLFFVIAFSMVFPFILPIRIYQILFTGYWYWGNYINPEFIPSISHTVLNASGHFSLGAFYGSTTASLSYTKPEAILNIIVILSLSVLAIASMSFLLNQQDKKA